GPVDIAVGDFNGDGIPDLALTGSGGIRVLSGNGDGSFQTSPFSYQSGAHSRGVAVGDFNGDGFLDLAVANLSSDRVTVLLNDTVWPSGDGDGSRPRAAGKDFSSADPKGSALPGAQHNSPNRFAVIGLAMPVRLISGASLVNTSNSVGGKGNPTSHQQVPQVTPVTANRPETAPANPSAASSRQAQDFLFIDEGFDFPPWWIGTGKRGIVADIVTE